MEELIKEMAQQIASAAVADITSKLRREFEPVVKAHLQYVYEESEAAAFLGTTEATLAAWRRRRLISYARYPIARIRDGHDDDSLGDTYTYSLSDLLSFRERYVINCVSPDKFVLAPVGNVVGIADRTMRKAA